MPTINRNDLDDYLSDENEDFENDEIKEEQKKFKNNKGPKREKDNKRRLDEEFSNN